ncbi:MAG: FtsX-like permease family protein [Methylomonas sp.]|nr:FtsX-like permease family protein [Methylomonas sp.]PPD21030.1 MAG: ABC transporter permease [Methylomonas sp.]PPD27057.1 MAG: ABC transporter permease [Methylomonas sp.]PPD38990.1 MAG: ABC transporter permease [Methylomonas sp.]PPD40890.1 MAG: ABC transporter permease [Methylomonas sp.]
MKRWRLALTWLWRDGRSGELSLLALALLIAVASATTISLFTDRLQRTMTLQAAEFLAGDLVVSGSTPLQAEWQQLALQRSLAQTTTIEFNSVLLENEQMLLASVKAVSDGYPLRGALKVRDVDQGTEYTLAHGPVSGEVWVERRVLSALGIAIGDTLTVGELPLVVSRVLSYEPDKRGDFYSLSPRVMMNAADLAATRVIQPGSHVHHHTQFAGEPAALDQFKTWLKPQLLPSQRLLDIHDDRPELGNALRRAERYLGLSSIVVIVIAGVAIAMAARRYAERHFDAAALLRCLGCRQRDIELIYLYQFLLLGLVVSLLGTALGGGGQMLLFHWLRHLLPQTLALPGPAAIFLGLAIGLLILLGFALPPLLRLRRVSALRVLRRDLEPLPVRAWLVYGLALSLLALLLWHHSADGRLTAIVLGGGLLGILLLGGLMSLLLQALQRLLPRVSVAWRFALQSLTRERRVSVGQILAFGVTLAAMALSLHVRNDLIAAWRQQLPHNAHNYFVLNIVPDRVDALKADFAANAIEVSPFYPIVRGRLVAINQEAVQRRVSKDSQGEAATQRELSLTWAASFPADNIVTGGQPWTKPMPGRVSVERKLADNLGITLGDQLTFTVGSTQLQATVDSLRSVHWDSMQPNFYMIFSPGTLDGFPATYLTSFYLAESQKPLLNSLLKQYPMLTVLEVDTLLKQMQAILIQISRAIDLLLTAALLAGFTVLLAAVYASLDRRRQEGALMRTLGATRSLVRKAHLIEFALLGALAGLMAAVLSQSVLYLLYSHVLHMPFTLAWAGWWLLPVIGAALIGLTGYWALRNIVRQPPMQVLMRS